MGRGKDLLSLVARTLREKGRYEKVRADEYEESVVGLLKDNTSG